MKRRLDEEIVRRQLLNSRTLAQKLILEGKVLLDGRVAIKPNEQVTEESSIEIIEPQKYVSRGGLKLEFALKEFGIDIADKIALDIGASTGGFTDCLLQHGAKKVYAVDVGKGLISLKLRNDPRVVLIEGVNARYLSQAEIKELIDIATIDVSFISVLKILPNIIPILRDEGDIVSLIKPQFEGERKFLKKGVVKDKDLHILILNKLFEEIKNLGLTIVDLTYSPIKGGEGNIEFFFHIKRNGVFVSIENIDKIVNEAWEKAK